MHMNGIIDNSDFPYPSVALNTPWEVCLTSDFVWFGKTSCGIVHPKSEFGEIELSISQ
jgi:hypothetical protein